MDEKCYDAEAGKKLWEESMRIWKGISTTVF